MRRWEFIDWMIAIVVASFAVGAVAEGIDWLDRRSCRVNGGHVEKIDNDWHCVGQAVRP